MAALAVAMLIGSAALAMSVNEPLPPDLEITAVSIEVVDQSSIHADISALNNSKERIVGYVGWLLFVPGDDPWAQRVYRSSGRAVDLQAGEQAEVDWIETAPVAIGEYHIEAWAHIDTGDGYRHADGWQMDGLEVAINHDWQLLRIEPPHQLVSIESAQLSSGAPAEWSVDIVLNNADDRQRRIDLRVDLIREPTSEPLWWKGASSLAMTTSIDLLPHESTSTSLSKEAVLVPGTYAVRVAATETPDRVLLDQALVGNDSFVVPDSDSSISRDLGPVGPLVVESIAADPTWSAEGAAVVTVEVTNMASYPVDGEMWWYLADPGDPEPWLYPVAASKHLQRNFQPGETRTVRLVGGGEVPVGVGYELSVWLHIVRGSETQHSDGVRFSQLIDVQRSGEQQ